MLLLNRLEIEGFGPYATPQTIEFPREHGVTLIYGENMAGKTSLLNSIRYALFGRVLGRGSRERRLHTLSNRALAAQGTYGFKVKLAFNSDGEDYELVQACRPLVDRPTSDADYVQAPKLRRGYDILGPDERNAALARVLPEDISRFFLFDGELLQEYEKLLYDDDSDGRQISEAIERILGVPLLQAAKAHVRHLADEAEAAEAKAASKHKNTMAVGNALKAATDRRKLYQDEIEELKAEIGELSTQKTEAESFLATQKKWTTLIQERSDAEKELKELLASIDADAASLRSHMTNAWRTVLAGPVKAARESAAREAAKAIEELTMRLRARAVEAGQCGVCEQDVGPEVAVRLSETIGDPFEFESSTKAAERLLDLDRFDSVDVSAAVKLLDQRLATARGRVAGLKDFIKDKNTELADADVDRLEGDANNLGQVIEKLAAKRDALDETTKKLAETEAGIKNLKANLARLGDGDLQESRVRSRLLQESAEVYAAAVEMYKSALRERVEATATDLFLRMTTEKNDYAGLRITDNYGLHLLHQDDMIEEGRSAGAEHVIALALMGALQANAPIRGPIIIDSPFGRLDPGHRANVVAALPTMARQVVLLVHTGEIEQHQVRDILGEKLVREYRMVKQSSRRTNIERVK